MESEKPRCFGLLCCNSSGFLRVCKEPYAVYLWEDCPLKKECYEENLRKVKEEKNRSNYLDYCNPQEIK